MKQKSADDKIRLNRYLSMAGAASRRKADGYIAAGRVTVNGRIVCDLGTRIDPKNDSVFLDGRQIVDIDPKVYILFNKPKDCITTLSDERGRSTVMDYVRLSTRVFPVGRLDRNTTGVLILTNDGDFAQGMMHPKNELKKTYLVTTDIPVTDTSLRKLAAGVRLTDGMTWPAEITLLPPKKHPRLAVTIHEGRNRQIHRMFESLGYSVDKLERVAYGTLTAAGVPRGRWRHLTPAEIDSLREESGLSTAVGPRSPGRKPAPPLRGRGSASAGSGGGPPRGIIRRRGVKQRIRKKPGRR